MPIYEYLCQACERQLEVMQRITEEPLAACPSCGGQLQRLISSTSFILKGSGWYATDYARKGSSGTQEKEEKKPASDKGSPEDKASSTAGQKKDD